MMGYYTGFGAFDAMFTIVPVIVVIGFIIVFGASWSEGSRGPPSGRRITTHRC